MEDRVDFNKVFHDSYQFFEDNDDIFYREFYRIFIGKSKKIEEAFAGTDIDKQISMLRIAVDNLVSFSVTKVADSYLLEISRRHNRLLGTSTDLYDVFMDALLEALESTYSDYNATCGLAWRITLSPGIEVMKHAHEV